VSTTTDRQDSRPSPPSGEQYEIRHGDQVAIVTEVGATLRSYAAGGANVVDGFAVDEISAAGRGQVLAPWPNRLDGGRYSFDGRAGRAAIDEPELGNAIHGLVRWLPWSSVAKTEHTVALRCLLHPQPAYPWRLELEIEYRLSPDGLRVGTNATNASEVPAPFGIGFHPYLTVGSPVDEATLTLPAARRLQLDERALPVGEEAVDGSAFDFRTARPIGATQLDTCFAGLVRDDDGRWRVRVEAEGSAVELWGSDGFGFVQAYTGDTLEPVSRRRQAIAIEPMTCPPNAFVSGRDVITLAPGVDWFAAWGIVPPVAGGA
jgi:aldose 1-epimerase